MRSRALLSAAVLALASLPVLALAQEAPPPIDCGPRDGRESLTRDGFDLTFDAPAVAIPELAATGPATAPASPFRRARFLFTTNFAPVAGAQVKTTLSWANLPSDYDIFIFDGEGNEIARSDAFNQTGPTSEEATIEIAHCQDFEVRVTNFAGSPAEKLNLKLAVTPGEMLLACAENDPAPGCAGKVAGDAPDFVPDARPRLYLGGDPGQVSMVHAFAGNPSLPQGRFETTRPTAGVPNQYTRPVGGFRDQYRNPFVAHWTTAFEQPRTINGPVSILLYASSTTEDATGTLYVDLYADAGLIGQAKVAGDQINEAPTPLLVTFPHVEALDALDMTLQVATNPAASSSGPGNPADAHVTLYYGSVQFPARITLP